MTAKLAKTDVFKALSDPTRREILNLLRKNPHPVNDLAHAFTVSRPAISKHLRILRSSHLVRERTQGRTHFYELNPAPLRDLDHWLDQYRSHWRKSLKNLKNYVESEKPK